MSQEIRVGDLVEIAYPTPCCGNTETCGQYFVVSRLLVASYYCDYCGVLGDKIGAWGKPDGNPTFFTRLRRIPPLEQLDGCSEDVHKIVKELAL